MSKKKIKKNDNIFFYIKKTAQGIVLAFIFATIFFISNGDTVLGEFLLHESLPYYTINTDMALLLKPDTNRLAAVKDDNSDTREVFSEAQPQSQTPAAEVPAVYSIESNQSLLGYTQVIGLNDITYQPEKEYINESNTKEALTVDDLDKLRDLSYLKNSFYTVTSRTDITAEDFNVDRFLSADLKIDNTVSGPKILVFHTHSAEMFADSDSGNIYEGIVGLGRELCRILESKYGIETLHHTSRYDIVDGKVYRDGAYERMEPAVEKIIAENPSLQVAIDLHRDGVLNENLKFVSNINGKPTAQIMFFNGLTKLKENGKLTPISILPNPYLGDNLALSFNMQLTANSLFPSFTRKVYLDAYRYSLNMLPKSLLIEVGAQTNTKEEAFNAMEPLADILAAVLLK